MSVYFGFSDSTTEFPETLTDICFGSLSNDNHKAKNYRYFDMSIPETFCEDTGVTQEQVTDLLKAIDSHPMFKRTIVDIPVLGRGWKETHPHQPRHHLIKLNNKHNVHQVIAIAAIVRNIFERPDYFLNSFDKLCEMGVPPKKAMMLAQDVDFIQKGKRVLFPVAGNHRVGNPLFWGPSHIFHFFNTSFWVDKEGFDFAWEDKSMFRGKGYHGDISSYVDGKGIVEKGIIHYLFYKKEDDQEKRFVPKFVRSSEKNRPRLNPSFSGSPEGRTYSIEAFKTHIDEFGWSE